jgi:hypothetical protein
METHRKPLERVMRRPRLKAALSLKTQRARRSGRPDQIVREADFVLATGELRREGFAELAGFALEGEEITSPGPTIRLQAGDEVTITLENVHGQFDEESISHDFVVWRSRMSW